MPIHLALLLAAAAGFYLAYRYIPALQLRGIVTLLLMGLIGYFLVITVAEMPSFGDPGNPVFNEISARYLYQSVSDTGAVNTVSAIITDYRAFDTLGEATVLFVAIAAVIATLKSH